MIKTRDFTFADGLTHGLVGPNGIGKTTLLRKIAGQIQSGGITVFGENPFDNQSVLNRVILMGIDNPLPDSWGIGKLGVIGKARWPRWDDERFNELLVRFDVPAKAYSSLSRGQKSAVGFIFAVASGCEVMLLDEPYLGLDAQRRELFYQVLREEHGRTMVISTHHLNVSLMGDNPISGPIDDFIEGILELTGPSESLTAAAEELGLPELTRTTTSLGDRVLIDARSASTDPIFRIAQANGLRVNEVSLERAVLALEERA